MTVPVHDNVRIDRRPNKVDVGDEVGKQMCLSWETRGQRLVRKLLQRLILEDRKSVQLRSRNLTRLDLKYATFSEQKIERTPPISGPNHTLRATQHAPLLCRVRQCYRRVSASNCTKSPSFNTIFSNPI
jgi:hypothetical protein